MSVLNAAGGLRYHFTALTARERWEPFRRSVASWLAGWNTGDSKNLALVGPSAGYNLPREILGRFATVEAFDPDLLARAALQLRFGIKASCADIFAMTDSEWERFLKEREGSSILFCNLLGQLPFLFAGEKLRQASSRLEAFFAQAQERGIRWASFHDRWSGKFLCLQDEAKFSNEPSDQELARAFLGEHARQVEIIEHKIAQIFRADLPRVYIRWQFKPHYVHLIECVLPS